MSQLNKLGELLELEKTDLFVFHGSGMKLSQLEPRQAYTFVDGAKVADGDPAIFASALVAYAIFMALINQQTCPNGSRSSCSYTDGQFTFSASRHTLDQLNDSTRGYVHVFNREDFILRGGCEWMCLKHIEPTQIIEISRADFLHPIEDIRHESW